MESLDYDILVIGGGHAGCEAAAAAARMGARTALITTDITKIAHLSCNPSVGGIGKGQIVREIDALGGHTACVTDATTLQFRMLNRSKGPAMHSPRAQCDKEKYTAEWLRRLERTDNLHLLQDTALALILEGNSCLGVRALRNGDLRAERVILCAGTFLNGLIHIGLHHEPGGRIDESSISTLTAQLESAGLRQMRFKTGTSARLDGRAIDYSLLIPQGSDESPSRFSYHSESASRLTPLPCHIGATNRKTHQIIAANLDKSPLYTNIIQGKGPRYCPSIEDKIRVFAGKESHQLFVEPETEKGTLVYINGLSSSLPLEVQAMAIRSIDALRHAHIVRPGYAVEYDLFDPRDLHHSLESKWIRKLYLAGQINGTTGYEEAAAQGLIAGINAALSRIGRPPIVLSRKEAYIGVMIDDLVTRGVDEPYRMFTSRAEHRLLLRQDNADERLHPIGHSIGLIRDEMLRRTEQKRARIETVIAHLWEVSASPLEANRILERKGSAQIDQRVKLARLALRPEITLNDLSPLISTEIRGSIDSETLRCAETVLKYGRYIDKQLADSLTLSELTLPIPYPTPPSAISQLSTEAREKLQKHKPQTVNEFMGIPGVKPSDTQNLISGLRRSVSRGTE